jgi:two-component system cell cycle response regulator DivK
MFLVLTTRSHARRSYPVYAHVIKSCENHIFYHRGRFIMAEGRLNTSSEKFDRKNDFLLVVDSEAYNLFYTSSLLKRFDYKPILAKSAKEAIQVAKASVPALIITSLGLSDMRGAELIKQMRENPATAGVPIITIERRRRRAAEESGKDISGDKHLSRPVSPETLHWAVQTAVEKTPREKIRIQTTLAVKVNDMPFDSPGGVCTATLSERGIFLPAEKPAAVDTRVSLELSLYGKTIAIDAVVIYSYPPEKRHDHEPGMGLEFVQITIEDQEVIRQYIHDEITRHIIPGNA